MLVELILRQVSLTGGVAFQYVQRLVGHPVHVQDKTPGNLIGLFLRRHGCSLALLAFRWFLCGCNPAHHRGTQWLSDRTHCLASSGLPGFPDAALVLVCSRTPSRQTVSRCSSLVVNEEH